MGLFCVCCSIYWVYECCVSYSYSTQLVCTPNSTYIIYLPQCQPPSFFIFLFFVFRFMQLVQNCDDGSQHKSRKICVKSDSQLKRRTNGMWPPLALGKPAIPIPTKNDGTTNLMVLFLFFFFLFCCCWSRCMFGMVLKWLGLILVLVGQHTFYELAYFIFIYLICFFARR